MKGCAPPPSTSLCVFERMHTCMHACMHACARASARERERKKERRRLGYSYHHPPPQSPASSPNVRSAHSKIESSERAPPAPGGWCCRGGGGEVSARVCVYVSWCIRAYRQDPSSRRPTNQSMARLARRVHASKHDQQAQSIDGTPRPRTHAPRPGLTGREDSSGWPIKERSSSSSSMSLTDCTGGGGWGG